jgi:hypothetical protein
VGLNEKAEAQYLGLDTLTFTLKWATTVNSTAQSNLVTRKEGAETDG